MIVQEAAPLVSQAGVGECRAERYLGPACGEGQSSYRLTETEHTLVRHV